MKHRRAQKLPRPTPTDRLKYQIVDLEQRLENAYLDKDTLLKRNQELTKKLDSRDIDRQLEARNKLASSLGQLMEAVAHAIQYTVAKESI